MKNISKKPSNKSKKIVRKKAGKGLEDKLKCIQRENSSLKKKLADKEWASEKTNQGIKILYKELQKKNERLLRLDQLKSDFVSIVSHELRTPLSIIKESINLVFDGVLGEINKNQNKMLFTASSNIERLSGIINDLLDISKIEAGKVNIKRSYIDFESLVDQIVLSFEPVVIQKGLSINKSFPEGSVNIYADRDKLIQVFTNLINNAIKFTRKGHIDIVVKNKQEEIEVELSDTGKGIKKEDLSKVFEKFQQFERVEGSGERGTGLGLSIVKGIIELHKGKIWVASDYGKGTKFNFVLPKVTYDEILEEYLKNAISKAAQTENNMSVVMISMIRFLQLSNEISKDKVKNLLKDVEATVRNYLRRADDVVLRDTHEIVVIMDCNKNGAVQVITRIKEGLENYLGSWNLIDKLKPQFGCATYPDDGRTYKELVKTARRYDEIKIS